MTAFRLALRNLLRNRLRTALTLAAIMFGAIGIILSGGFVHDMYGQLAEALIHSQTGHLQVARQGYFTKGAGQPEEFVIADLESVHRKLAATPGVGAAMARLRFSGLAATTRGDRPIVGEGIEPQRESALATHLQILKGRALTGKDTFSVMVGQGLAQSLRIEPGDRLDLLVTASGGALNTLEFDVVGVFQTFSREYDARAVRVPLRAAHELVGTPGATTLVVTMQHTENTDDAARDLKQQLQRDGLELRTWKELNDFYEKTVTLYDRQFGVLQAIVLVMVLLGVANSINILVFERRGEFGTMMALGDRRRDIFGLILMESTLLGIIGGALGVTTGVGVALLVSHIGIPMPPPPNSNLGYMAQIRVVPGVVLLAFLVSVGASMLAAITPAIRIVRTSVVDALRANV